ncbi:hypothetical protein [Streptomyces sp. KN37]|uniref:hypothetical protein n=1 Tax=Streptomyces sp. KN37 TaxID=3090667 RepID=UPI002A7572BC|nr:hypothetical protein [Streptomyces sp. KN37]WPO69945.1 hypothetical protein R9806_04515 [Streptomyces sp. KN37]
MSHSIAPRQRHLNAAQGVDLGVLYSTVSAGMLLVRRYLTGRGIDQAFADRYGSAFGRTAAKLYRKHRDGEPRRAWSLVSGKWRRVNGYLPQDAEILDEAFSAYPRTASYEPACRVPRCDRLLHSEGICSVDLTDIPTREGYVSLVATAGGPMCVDFSCQVSGELSDLDEARAQAGRLRALADAIDGAAALLPA